MVRRSAPHSFRAAARAFCRELAESLPTPAPPGGHEGVRRALGHLALAGLVQLAQHLQALEQVPGLLVALGTHPRR
jgi:hypothetical protein